MIPSNGYNFSNIFNTANGIVLLFLILTKKKKTWFGLFNRISALVLYYLSILTTRLQSINLRYFATGEDMQSDIEFER